MPSHPRLRRGRRSRVRYICECRSEVPATVTDDVNANTSEPKPFKFGQKADYWEVYDEVTEKFDEDMVERLHIGLDNLLIFVSAGQSQKFYIHS